MSTELFNNIQTDGGYDYRRYVRWGRDIRTNLTARTLAGLTPEGYAEVERVEGPNPERVPNAFRIALMRAQDEAKIGAHYGYGSFMATGWKSTPVVVTKSEPAQEATVSQKAIEAVPSRITFEVEGQLEINDMSPIPNVPGEDVRTGIEYVVPLVACCYKIDGDQIKIAIRTEEWRACMKASAYDPVGIEKIFPVVSAIFDPVIKEMKPTARTALTNVRWVQFVKSILLAADTEQYLVLHSSIARNVIRRKDEYGYMTQTLSSEDCAPGSKQETVIKKLKGQAALTVSYAKPEHCPELILTQKASKTTHQTFLRAHSAMQSMSALLGEATSSVNAFIQTRGFCSMMSTSECDITWLVSSFLGLLSMGRTVSVAMGSLSYMEPLVASYDEWMKTRTASPKFVFVVPSTEISNVRPEYRPYLATTQLEGSVFLWDHNGVVSSKSRIEEKVQDSKAFYEVLTQYKRYVIRTAIYGYMVDGVKKNTHSLYQMGLGHCFRGTLSTETDLVMLAKSGKSGSYYHKPLEKVQVKDWYDYVAESCSVAIAAPFRPNIHASEIVNVVRADKGKFRITLKSDGLYHMETLGALSQISYEDLGDTDDDDDEDHEPMPEYDADEDALKQQPEEGEKPPDTSSNSSNSSNTQPERAPPRLKEVKKRVLLTQDD